MKRRFLYFINPISGTRKKDRLQSLIRRSMEKAKYDFEIIYTNAEGEYNFLLEKMVTNQITDVVICGGDGTISQISNTVRKNPGVRIGIIPMGSGNGLALAAHIPLQTSRALEIILQGNAKPVDALLINGRFSCMLCGLGFDAQVAHDFAKQKRRGWTSYARQIIKHFSKASAYPFEISLNNNRIHTQAFFISIANSNQFGNHITIAPMASISDGLLDIVVVNKMSKSKLLFSVLKQIFFGKADLTMQNKFHTDDIQYFQTRSLKIKNPEKALLHIDGDPAPTQDYFEITIIDAAFPLIQP